MNRMNTPKILPPDEAEALADRLIEWFADVLDYLERSRWTFRVDSKGHYLKGDVNRKKPCAFQFKKGADGDRFEFRIEVLSKTERFPHRDCEVDDRRDTVHKCVTIILMNLLGSPKTGKRLADLRKDYDLPKLRQVDIM